MAGYVDIGEYRYEAMRDFTNLQERFKKNFGRLNEEELRIFKIKVSELLDLLRDKRTRYR